MKILHTADWHIGKKLHNYELAEDFHLFIEWLTQCVQEKKVDYILVSGDVFDLANPSSAARNQYYQSLVKLKKHVKGIILTGGNHDSPAMLDAPKQMMQTLNLNVVGGLPENLKDTLIPLTNAQNEVEVIVAAIPYLRNPDIKVDAVMKEEKGRIEALRNGISRVFEELSELCAAHYKNVPVIAMGHLFAMGVETSEGEREIQIGNLAGISGSTFGNYFKYVALGHIHKPQQIKGSQPIFYSGSPIPLSFSERNDEKRILIIDTDKGWEPESVSVPNFRKLIKIKGKLEKIDSALQNLMEKEGLENLIEIELIEENYQEKLIYDLEELISDFSKKGNVIVKHRIRFKNALQKTGALFENHVNLDELNVSEVFEEMLHQNDFSSKEKEEIENAFKELLEELGQ